MPVSLEEDLKQIKAELPRPSDDNTTSLAFSSDGELLAVTNTQTHIYNVTRSDMPVIMDKVEHRFFGHAPGGVKNVVWHPDTPTVFATRGLDNCVPVHDLRQSQKRATTTYFFENDISVAGWCGEMFIVVDGMNNLYKIDPKAANLPENGTFKAKEHALRFNIGKIIDFTSTEHRLYLACDTGHVHFFDVPDLTNQYSVLAHGESCNSINLDPMMDHFAVASDDGTVSVWHEESVTSRFVCDYFEHPVQMAKYSCYNSNLLAVADGRTIMLLDADTGFCTHKITADSRINTLDWHPSKPLLVYSCENDTNPYNIWGYPRDKRKDSR